MGLQCDIQNDTGPALVNMLFVMHDLVVSLSRVRGTNARLLRGKGAEEEEEE